MFNHNPYKLKMKRIYFFRVFQALLVFSLAFTLTNCGNIDNPLEELGGGSGGSSVSVTSISLDQTTLDMKVGDADVTLTATVDPAGTAVTWSSDNAAATVTDGVVHAVAAGTAIITATAGDKSATCTVTVTEVYTAKDYKEGSWDVTNNKVVFTKQTAPSDPTPLANSVTSWSGWYTVSGEVTINGDVTLTADAHLILQDGATLTINGQLDCGTNQKNLYIYGQKKGDGKLNVTNNSGMAIFSSAGYRIDIHGGEVTAEATGGTDFGLYAGYLAVYGGKLTATSGGDNGIAFVNTIDVYGGEVVATSNATSKVCFGIKSGGGLATQILTVYGGKVTATGSGVPLSTNYGSGFGCYVMSGTSGIKFYFTADVTDWGDGNSYASATSVGQNADAAATKKKFAKAE